MKKNRSVLSVGNKNIAVQIIMFFIVFTVVIVGVCLLMTRDKRQTNIMGTYFYEGQIFSDTLSPHISFEQSEVSNGLYGGTATDENGDLYRWTAVEPGREEFLGYLVLLRNGTQMDFEIVDDFTLRCGIGLENETSNDNDINDDGDLLGKYSIPRSTCRSFGLPYEECVFLFNGDGTGTYIFDYPYDVKMQGKLAYSVASDTVTIKVYKDTWDWTNYYLDIKYGSHLELPVFLKK